jgi:hypothetical protein
MPQQEAHHGFARSNFAPTNGWSVQLSADRDRLPIDCRSGFDLNRRARAGTPGAVDQNLSAAMLGNIRERKQDLSKVRFVSVGKVESAESEAHGANGDGTRGPYTVRLFRVRDARQPGAHSIQAHETVRFRTR